MIEIAIDVLLLAGLLLTAVAVARSRDLFTAVMLSGLFSVLSASAFLQMDAADVAFTEAAVGAGVSTLLMLAALRLLGRYERAPRKPQWLALLIVLATGATLVYGTQDLPPFGAADNPIHRHVADRYLEKSGAEIGIPNVVTSVLASYRGYDTLGETVVVFTAALAVLLLLGGGRRRSATANPATTGEGNDVASAWRDHLILRVVARFLIPLIVLFALYVQFHGDYGPGGGFQAGAIIAAGVLLHLLVFGLGPTLRILPQRLLWVIASLGVLVYAGTGVASLLLGANYLDYSVLAANAVGGQHLGIFLVELGVMLTVSAGLILILIAFHQRHAVASAGAP